MYAPYQVYANIPVHPFKSYDPIGCTPSTLGPKQVTRQLNLNRVMSEDDARTRTYDGNLSGYRSYSSGVGPELHPYTTFVEGYQSSGAVRFPNMDVAPEGMLSLFKEDFHTLENGELRLNDKRLAGKEAFIVFVLNSCSECQDTKQAWKAYACGAAHTQRLSQFFRKTGGSTAGMQYLMFKRRDGLLVDV